MSVESPNLEKKTIMALCLLLFLVSAIIAVLSFLIFDVFWIMILPVSFLIVIFIAQAFSRFFWNTDKKCPRCNYSASIYSEFCPNCGFKLLLACPECQSVITYDNQICKSCGYKYKKIIILDDVEIKLALDVKPDENIGEKFPFCPHCGINLGHEQQNLRFCETCGGRLNS